MEIIVCAADGEVRGYLPTDASEGATAESSSSLSEVARDLQVAAPFSIFSASMLPPERRLGPGTGRTAARRCGLQLRTT